jgi:hypothetical protein
LFGPGALVHHAVVCEGGRVTYAGPSAAAPPADEFLQADGFLMRVWPIGTSTSGSPIRGRSSSEA